jgi:azurin
MTTSLRLLALLAAGGIAAALVGCGPSEKTAAPAPAAPADGVRTVAITANDAMQYSVKEIRARSGEKLRVTLTNTGKMPKQAMAHNWVLLKPMSDSELNAFGMAASAKPPTYMPDDASAVLVHTKMLGAGEKDMVEFAAPSAAGQYPFICTFPGHFAIMRGKLIVE